MYHFIKDLITTQAKVGLHLFTILQYYTIVQASSVARNSLRSKATPNSYTNVVLLTETPFIPTRNAVRTSTKTQA